MMQFRFTAFYVFVFITVVLIPLRQAVFSPARVKKVRNKFKNIHFCNKRDLVQRSSLNQAKSDPRNIFFIGNEDFYTIIPALTPMAAAEKHYNSKRSSCPPAVNGKLRLYSMRFCPFCQRARLVLQAKGIPHDVVNINLKDKPDWLFSIHPEGKVPALDTGNKVVIESLDIADFLDTEYPSPALYPSDEMGKAQDKELIKKYGKVVGATTDAIYSTGNKPTDVYVANIVTSLKDFDDELAKRGSTFFGGSAPGMVDYMMWPWIERVEVPAAVRNEEFKFPWDKIPKLAEWVKCMEGDPAVKDTFIDKETHAKFLRQYFGETPVFDNI